MQWLLIDAKKKLPKILIENFTIAHLPENTWTHWSKLTAFKVKLLGYFVAYLRIEKDISKNQGKSEETMDFNE